jgi:hypothetical protein
VCGRPYGRRLKFDLGMIHRTDFHMKNILKNSILIPFAVALSLVVAEVALRMEGRYRDLASQVLVPSQAIWELPTNKIVFGFRHPDLDVPIESRYDRDGVRNHSELSTREKRNIIGIFGDSFVENNRVEDRFTFTSILDAAARPRARVVNYGVDGYGLDQEYLRYKKYETHDIRDVVYVFCQNDLRDLYETGLTDMTKSGDVVFSEPRTNPFFRFTGRLHLTYLVITAYYKSRGLVDLIRSGKKEWKSVGLESNDWVEKMREMRTREDQYSDTITTELLSLNPSADTLRLTQKFLVLLEKWKREVEARQRTFTVLALPWKLDDAVATKLFRNFDGNVVHSIDFFNNCKNCIFQNDNHWNEYGNERVAEFILSERSFPFHDKFEMISTASIKTQIDEYYDQHRH